MDEKDKRIGELEGLVAKQGLIIRKLEERIVELERRLGTNSSNSHKPPSSDGYKKPSPVSLRVKSKNPSGGQKGHQGSTLQQVENPTNIIQHQVNECSVCGLSLKNEPPTRVIKRQVFDIPQPSIEVTEHEVIGKGCTCGHETVAEFPSNLLGPVQYGPRVKGLCVYLSNQQFIPEDRLQQTFIDVFGLPISKATLCQFNAKFAAAVSPLQEESLSILKASPVKHQDETGIRIQGKTEWLHVISDEKYTHYRTSQKRGNLLEGLKGISIHDGWKPYFTMEGVEHGLCNAHHLRELKALEAEPWAIKMSKLLRIGARMINQSKSSIERIRLLYDKILKAGLAYHQSKSVLEVGKRKRRTGHNLLLRLEKFKNAVLLFLENPLVSFTNNQAEQDIRMMKVKQKISGGFRSASGAEIFCTIRGFISTQRKLQANLFQQIYNIFVLVPG